MPEASAGRRSSNTTTRRPTHAVVQQRSNVTERGLRVDRIDSLLPQTQCGKCGFDGCRPYAEAIADDIAPIDRCPPGGDRGVLRLAALLGRPQTALDPTFGPQTPRQIARIVEPLCIGCTRCIQACPVDAIVGAARWMHAIVTDACTGCGLCVPPCPVDCIVIEPLMHAAAWTDSDAAAARRAFERRRTRLDRLQRERDARLRARSASPPAALPTDAPETASSETAGAPHEPSRIADADAARRRAVIDAALARARERLATPRR